MPTVAEATTPQLSGDYRADALMGTFANWNYLTPDITPAANTIYYTFTGSAALTTAAPDGSPIAFNADQQAAARAILAYCATVTGINFVETANAAEADFHFANANLVGPSTAGLCKTSWSYGSSGGNLTSYSAEAYIFLDDVEFLATNLDPDAGAGSSRDQHGLVLQQAVAGDVWRCGHHFSPRGSFGMPRPRSAIRFSWISLVPA